MSIRETLSLAVFLGVLAWAGCGRAKPPTAISPLAPPPMPVFNSTKLGEMEINIKRAVAEGMLAGRAHWVERNMTAYHRALIPRQELTTEDTISDIGSLRKAVAAGPAIMLKSKRGQVRLDAPLMTYIPEFRGDGRESMTVSHLPTHASSLRPDRNGRVLPLQATLARLAAEGGIGVDFANVPGAVRPRRLAANMHPTSATPSRTAPVHVLTGIDVLVQQDFKPLRGLRVGLITNQTGRDRHGNSTIDLLRSAKGVTLKALFSPEHGIRGDLDTKVDDGVDDKTGLPVFSLFPAVPRLDPARPADDQEALEIRKPRPAQLRDLDALVFDIQDVGCRFYTYITTMGNCLEAAGSHGLKFFVLDRVNPINGTTLDGPVMQGQPNFVGYHTLPLRHGMTVGELARMFNTERGFKTHLMVIPLQGWRRELYLDQTDLPWVNPSPNMRSLTEATLYPGVGLLETTTLSVGRGTGTPFEIIGAPYIDEQRLLAELNRVPLPGVRFEPVRFTPTASTFKGQECGGVRMQLTDRDHCRIVDLGILLAQVLHRLYPQEFDLSKFNQLLRHPPTLEAINMGNSLIQIRASWAEELDQFRVRRGKFLLYP